MTASLITGLAPDQIFFRQAGTSKKNVFTDALGSTLATASSVATPAIQNSFTYDPFGTPDSAAFPYLFTGRDYNSASGLQYNRARYYTPAYGRFVSEDPIGILGGSANGYVYGANAPTVFSDWLGLEPGQRDCLIVCLPTWAVSLLSIALDIAVLALIFAAAPEAGMFVLAAEWNTSLLFAASVASYAGFVLTEGFSSSQVDHIVGGNNYFAATALAEVAPPVAALYGWVQLAWDVLRGTGQLPDREFGTGG